MFNSRIIQQYSQAVKSRVSSGSVQNLGKTSEVLKTSEVFMAQNLGCTAGFSAVVHPPHLHGNSPPVSAWGQSPKGHRQPTRRTPTWPMVSAFVRSAQRKPSTRPAVSPLLGGQPGRGTRWGEKPNRRPLGNRRYVGHSARTTPCRSSSLGGALAEPAASGSCLQYSTTKTANTPNITPRTPAITVLNRRRGLTGTLGTLA